MKPENLLEAMEHIKPDYIAEAKPAPKMPGFCEDKQDDFGIRQAERNKPMKTITQHIMTGVSIAAAAAVCAGIGVFIAKNNKDDKLTPPTAQTTAAATTGINTDAQKPVSAEKNYLGGTGKLHFEQLGDVVLGSDDEYWYLFDTQICYVKKSGDRYLPLNGSGEPIDYFGQKLGQEPVKHYVDTKGHLYLTLMRENVNEKTGASEGEIEVIRVTDDGNTESMGTIRFGMIGEKLYISNIRYIDVYGEDDNTISLMGYSDVVDDLGALTGYKPTFTVTAELKDGKFGELNSKDFEYGKEETDDKEQKSGYVWGKDGYTYYLKDGNLVRQSFIDSNNPHEELIAGELPIKALAQEMGSNEMYSLRTDGTIIYKSDVKWSDPQSIWDMAKDKTRWRSVKDDTEMIGQLPVALGGVFDGKLWVDTSSHVIMLIDTQTNGIQYIYFPNIAEPVTDGETTEPAVTTEMTEATEPTATTTAVQYSKDETQAIQFAKYAFEEWVDIWLDPEQQGKGGDMHQYAKDKNLAAYLNYAAKEYGYVERVNLTESTVSLDDITVKNKTDAEDGMTYYTITGTGKWNYKNWNGGGAFGTFTFVLKDQGFYVYELTEMTHYAMDSVDMNLRPDYLYNEEPDPNFWAKPERYEPLMQSAKLALAETGTVKCPVADFTKDRVRFCNSGYTPNVVQASDTMKTALYSALAKTAWETTDNAEQDGESSSIFIYNGGTNPCRLDFFFNTAHKPVVRVVYYETDRNPDTYVISADTYNAVNDVIMGKTVSNLPDYYIECCLDDVAYLNTIGVWQDKYPDKTLPDDSASAKTTSEIKGSTISKYPIFYEVPVPYNTIYRLLAVNGENGETLYYRTKYVGDFKYGYPDLSTVEPDELVAVTFKPEAFERPKDGGLFETRPVTDSSERKNVLRSGREVSIVNGASA